MKELYQHQKVKVKKAGREVCYTVTCCFLYQEERNWKEELANACGIALCSYKDQYNRKKGNLIAKGRAIKALESKKTDHRLGSRLTQLTGVRYLQVYLGS